jgi:hypothetical protein
MACGPPQRGRKTYEYNRQRSKRKDCGGAGICDSICEHNCIRSRCKDCGGAGICEHNRRRSKCKDCGGACADVYEATVNILHRNWKPPRFFLVLYVYEVFAFAKKRKNSLLCYYSLPSPSLEPSLLFAKAGWVCHTDT